MLHPAAVAPLLLLQELRDFVKQLLQRKPAYRLGQGTSHAGAIKKHPWFAGFDWDAFVAKKLKAPYMPVVSRKHGDLSGFKPEPETFLHLRRCYCNSFCSLPVEALASLCSVAAAAAAAHVHSCTFKTIRCVSVVVCVSTRMHRSSLLLMPATSTLHWTTIRQVAHTGASPTPPKETSRTSETLYHASTLLSCKLRGAPALVPPTMGALPTARSCAVRCSIVTVASWLLACC